MYSEFNLTWEKSHGYQCSFYGVFLYRRRHALPSNLRRPGSPPSLDRERQNGGPATVRECHDEHHHVHLRGVRRHDRRRPGLSGLRRRKLLDRFAHSFRSECSPVLELPQRQARLTDLVSNRKVSYIQNSPPPRLTISGAFASPTLFWYNAGHRWRLFRQHCHTFR